MYQEAIIQAKFRVNKQSRQCNQLSALRLILFLSGGVISYLLIGTPPVVLVGFIISWIASFLYLVKYHDFKQEKLQFEKDYLRVSELEQQAHDGDYSSFHDGEKYQDSSHAFSKDLDLFSSNSFFQYINRSHVALGEAMLAGMLSKQALDKDQIIQRQEAVLELKEKPEFRMHFRTLTQGFHPEDSFPKWHMPLQVKSYWTLISLIFSSINAALLVSCICSLLPWSIFSIFPAFGLLIIAFYSGKITKRMNWRNKQANYLKQCLKLITLVDQEVFESAILKEKHSLLHSKNGSLAAMKSLLKILKQFDYRNNLYVGLFLNLFFLWDMRCMGKLAKWEGLNTHKLEECIEILKIFDCYNSLAFCAYNHPEFKFPEIHPSEARIFKVINMGHPLIPKNKRVGNDYDSAHSPFSIVTGANMAGKSTFLRSIGLNIVMACAGLPVCADQMSYSPIKLYSSMRTTDSISKNESYFFAELHRLQYIIEEAERSEGQVFMLLDEILKGTNSKDKEEGSRLILKKIVLLGAHGCIATHDLALCSLSAAYPQVLRNLCFEITFEDEEMKFDYKIAEGITQNMNALYLIAKMGLV